ncbi:MAG: two pore domain potassium channel family protein, partial [Gammaproteobacteria bacterium]|nr:two pore domain potassium channel family protein [Gammaproteobacteria bacterium]
VVPAHPLAKAFAYLEAVIGQIFLAMMIAHLVGLNISQQYRG